MSVVRSATDIRRLAALAFGAMWLAACSAQATPTPTPDLFSGVAQQADQAFAQGMDLYQAGRYRDASDAFNRARLLSPSSDSRIEEMIRLTNAQLTPTATPAPPSPTTTLAPTPVPMSEATPYPEFSQAYFGQTFLAVVPGKGGSAVPMDRFSTQDQVGLYVEKLDERLHLAFKLRIFDVEARALITEVTGDNVQRFADRFVWYHTGGETTGHFRAELYAGDVLANTFDYEVGTEPVAIPTPVIDATPLPMASESATPVNTPVSVPVPAPVPVAIAPTQHVIAPRSVPIPIPPTPTREVPSATRISMPGGPAALAHADATDDLFVADRTGLIWLLRHGEAALTRPYAVSGEPIGLAVDPAGQRLYVAVRDPAALIVLDSTTGQQIASAPLPVEPGDIRLDPGAGSVSVVLPQKDALQILDTRDLQTSKTITELKQVTGLALDEKQHTLYVSQLDGQIAAIDPLRGLVTRRWIASGDGLAGLAVADDQVFAVNAAERVLIQGNLSTGDATRTQLDVEPAAVALGAQSGAIYILGVDANVVLRTDGANTTRVALGDDAPAVASDLSAQTVWVRPRMVTSSTDERLYVIEPEAAILAISAGGT